MKIVHINTYDYGGAAKAALEIHEGLLKQGLDSNFLCLHDSGKFIRNKKVFPKYTTKIVTKFFLKTGLYKTNAERNYRNLISSSNYDQFTFPNTDFDITSHKLVQEADIIHLHWVGNFLDYKSFFSKIEKPIVWTLHDKNPAMGGYHLEIDYYRENNLQDLEKKLVNIKHNALKRLDNISIVCPSRSLMRYSERSKILKRFPHHNIPNCVNLDRFHNQDKNSLKRLFKIPDSKIHFLASEYNKNIFHKGFDILEKAITNIDKEKAHFTLLSNSNKEETGENYTIIPKATDDRYLNLLYTSADALIISSREENLPNMMLESMASGTPVLGFPAGGLKDVIDDYFNGLLAKNVSVESMTNVIKEFSDNKERFNPEKIRQYTEKHFSYKKVISQYMDLYRSVNE